MKRMLSLSLSIAIVLGLSAMSFASIDSQEMESHDHSVTYVFDSKGNQIDIEVNEQNNMLRALFCCSPGKDRITDYVGETHVLRSSNSCQMTRTPIMQCSNCGSYWYGTAVKSTHRPGATAYCPY